MGLLEMGESQHEAFMEGFGDIVGIYSCDIEASYAVWRRLCGINEVEAIDIETGGYQAGLEVGQAYKRYLEGSKE